MKFQVPFSRSTRGGLPMQAASFTLTEILIAMAVFLFVVGAVISANVFGLRMFQMNQAKLNVTQWSRETLGNIMNEVHAYNTVWVGNITTNSYFEGLLDGEAQQGNALQIYPTSSTNTYTTYFVNSSDDTFRQTVITPSGTNTVILADAVTNTMAFSAQDFSGNVLTNVENNRVIHLTLEFYQPAGFMQGADYYKLETSVTRRALQ